MDMLKGLLATMTVLTLSAQVMAEAPKTVKHAKRTKSASVAVMPSVSQAAQVEQVRRVAQAEQRRLAEQLKHATQTRHLSSLQQKTEVKHLAQVDQKKLAETINQAAKAPTDTPPLPASSESNVSSNATSSSQPAQAVMADSTSTEEVPAEEVLPEGAQVVAGDPDKNEFFILAKGQPVPEVKMERIKRLENLPEVPAENPQVVTIQRKHKLPTPDLTPRHHTEVALNNIPKPNVVIVHGEYRENMRPHLEQKTVDSAALAGRPMVASLSAELNKPLQPSVAEMTVPEVRHVLAQTSRGSDVKAAHVSAAMRHALTEEEQAAARQRQGEHGMRGLVTNAENTKEAPAKIESVQPAVAKASSLIADDRKVDQGQSASQAKALIQGVKPSAVLAAVEHQIPADLLRSREELQSTMKLAMLQAPAAAEGEVSAARVKSHRHIAEAKQRRVQIDKHASSLKTKLAVREAAGSKRLAKAKLKSMKSVAVHHADIQVISMADAERAKQQARLSKISVKSIKATKLASKKESAKKTYAAAPRRSRTQVVLTDSDYEVVYKNAAYTVKRIEVNG